MGFEPTIFRLQGERSSKRAPMAGARYQASGGAYQTAEQSDSISLTRYSERVNRVP